jgi:hypothetical protein
VNFGEDFDFQQQFGDLLVGSSVSSLENNLAVLIAAIDPSKNTVLDAASVTYLSLSYSSLPVTFMQRKHATSGSGIDRDPPSFVRDTLISYVIWLII